MPIQKLHLELRPFSKPRGQIGKYGNMTHSIGKYRQWQEEFKLLIASTTFKVPSSFYAIIFDFKLSPRRGGKPDLSNLQGGVEDALVKYGYILDDNWKVLQRYYTVGTPASKSSIDLYVCESKKELIYSILNFTD